MEVELEQPAGKGDGTVPESSGKALDQTGQAPDTAGPARPFAGVEHEPAYHSDQHPGNTTVDFTLQAVENLCRLKIKRA